MKVWFNLVICTFVGLSLFIISHAYAGSRATTDFKIHSDGKVTAGNNVFDNFESYVKSDLFKKHGKRCGTVAPSPGFKAKEPALAEDCTMALTRINPVYYPAMVLTIPVYFHVITMEDGLGDLSDQRIEDQIAVLNEDFRAMPGSMGEAGYDVLIQFELEGITRTQNDDWFNDYDEFEYKSALARDPERYLNIYTNSASGWLGYSYFPQEDAGTVIDGVVIYYEAIGGRDNGFYIYDQGRTLVHEIGHYFGLLHTFEQIGESCGNTYESGDLVVDTPAESWEHYDCVQTDTCSSPDPIHNYMNYTPDSCMHEFTMEQANRMVCALMNYRPDLCSAAPAQTPVPTLSPWGLLSLGMLLALASLAAILRRRENRPGQNV